MPSLFKYWKSRASSLGHILTHREKITKNQEEDIKSLTYEKENGVNINGNKVSWTTSKQNKLNDLISKRDAPDVLPEGVKTHLDNVFRSQYWGRKRQLYNKFLDKGNICEQDSLDLVSQIDGYFYQKNDTQYENDWLTGEPDNVQICVKDTKTNFDMESFDNATLTELYKWQVKAYIYLTLPELNNYKGELIYCLVNNPYHQLMNEKTSLYYKMGQPDEDDERWQDAMVQLEKNMIFNVQKWKQDYPGYDFYNPTHDFSIPPIFRIKRYEVTLNTRDIAFMKSRIKMARKYLMDKEKEVIDKLKQYELTRKT